VSRAVSFRTADGGPGLGGAIVVAAFLALVSAMCFALAAALQQRGQFTLAHAGSAVRGLTGLFRLVAVPVWLLGTLILLAGYATQGVALGRGRLVVVQPLMVTTIVWALPLGYWLTSQHVVRRQVLGAVVAGAALLAALGGAVLITLANRDTQLPGQPTGTYGALTDETLG
jgi:hypothetical protein